MSADLVCEWKSKVVHKPNRMYHKGKYDKIAEGLNQIDWDTCFEGRSVQECWDIFKERLKTLEIENIPLYTPKGLYKEPWMNRPLMKQWKKKYFAWKRFTENRSYIRYQEYKKEASLMKKQARKTKRTYEKKIAKEARQNKRQFIRYVNSKLTVRPEISEMQNELGELVDNDKDICNILAKYFNSVYTAMSNEMPEMEDMYLKEIKAIEVTQERIQSKLERVNVTKSCGSDDIHPYILQKTANATSVPLEKIFRKSLSTGECPSDWRSANVTPIHKKGDRTAPENYRPISLTSQVCKVLESLVREHIIEPFNENNVLRDEQHVFRERR